mgnify:CR=1 FL=1
MEITVNGEIRSFSSPLSVSELLRLLGIDPELVVVERNFEITPRSAFDGEMLSEGDSIEIIRMVGGG